MSRQHELVDAQPPLALEPDGRSTSLSLQGLARAAPQTMRDGSLVVVVLAMLFFLSLDVYVAIANGTVGFDFRGTLWDPANAIREGRSPYPAPVRSEVDVGNPAVYPPVLMILAVPLSLLPWKLGLAVWLLLGAASIVGALCILGVRDLRCYVVALICAPTAVGIAWGNATLLLVPLVALAWHWRDRTYRGGAVLGVAIAAKLFLWPLVFWLLGTRRYLAALAALIVSVASTVLAWAIIGFAGATSYPSLLRTAESVYAAHSFSVATILGGLGVGEHIAPRGAAVVGIVLGACAFLLGRVRVDAASYSIGVLAAILGSPIVWPYYFVLLLAPVAVVRRSFSWLWMALALFYLALRLPRPRLDPAEAPAAGVVPDGVPLQVWNMTHAPPGLWPAVGHAALGVGIAVTVAWIAIRTKDRAGSGAAVR